MKIDVITMNVSLREREKYYIYLTNATKIHKNGRE